MEHKQLYPVKWEKRCLSQHIAAARVNAVTSWSVSNKSYTALTYALLTYATVHQEVLDLIPKLIQKVSLVFLKKNLITTRSMEVDSASSSTLSLS